MATYTLTADVKVLEVRGNLASLLARRLLTADMKGMEPTGPATSLLARRLLTATQRTTQLYGPDVALTAPSATVTFSETRQMQPRIAVVAVTSLAEIRAMRMKTDSGPQIVMRVHPSLFTDNYVWTTDVTSTDDADLVLVPDQTPRVGCWKRLDVTGGGP